MQSKGSVEQFGGVCKSVEVSIGQWYESDEEVHCVVMNRWTVWSTLCIPLWLTNYTLRILWAACTLRTGYRRFVVNKHICLETQLCLEVIFVSMIRLLWMIHITHWTHQLMLFVSLQILRACSDWTSPPVCIGQTTQLSKRCVYGTRWRWMIMAHVLRSPPPPRLTRTWKSN
jgi:hypothetical protein